MIKIYPFLILIVLILALIFTLWPFPSIVAVNWVGFFLFDLAVAVSTVSMRQLTKERL